MPRTPQSGVEQQLARLAGEEITPRTPQSRVEKQLARLAGETIETDPPQSAEEEWLEIIYEQGGGGGGITPTGTINVTENGTYDVTEYAETNVAVYQGFDYRGLSGLKFTYNTDTTIDLSALDTSGFTSMNYMFDNCSALTSLDVSGFDTSNVTSMALFFNNCTSLSSLDVSGFDTSNVTSMLNMFNNCSSLTSLDVSSFDTSNVTNTQSMFVNCSSLSSLDVSGFDTSKVTTMLYMFRGCSSLCSLDLSGFDTSKVKNMNRMFNGFGGSLAVTDTISLNLASFTTVSATDMEYMMLNLGPDGMPSQYKHVIWAIESTTVQPMVSANAFYNTSSSRGNCPRIYVRDSLVSAYKSATNWNTYSSSIKPISELPVALQELYNIDPNDYQ